MDPRFPESIDAEPRSRLPILADRCWASETYLAGSAALALYLGHRPVRDLDLMSQANRLRAAERRDLLQDVLAFEEAARVETARDGYLFLRMREGWGLKLFYYPYPLVEPERKVEGLLVASPLDLGLMKLGAVISRGTRRDFVDLYLLCRSLPLEELLRRSGEKFGHVRDFPLQALKALVDFSLVEGEPLPRLAEPLDWNAVEEWFQDEVRRLGGKRIGLG